MLELRAAEHAQKSDWLGAQQPDASPPAWLMISAAADIYSASEGENSKYLQVRKAATETWEF